MFPEIGLFNNGIQHEPFYFILIIDFDTATLILYILCNTNMWEHLVLSYFGLTIFNINVISCKENAFKYDLQTFFWNYFSHQNKYAINLFIDQTKVLSSRHRL